MALLLDHHVNRPAHVDNAFGLALDWFYAANPKASHDPADWTTEQRAQYEPKILSNYQVTRELKYNGSAMTDAEKRAAQIVDSSSPLSANPGSFVRTGT